MFAGCLTTITQCQFVGNSAAGAGSQEVESGVALSLAAGKGGAVHASIAHAGGLFCTLSVTGSTFTGNTAQSGGAVYVDNFGFLNSNGETNITKSLFRGNQAQKQGGAVFIADTSHLLLSESLFDDNHATQQGGAIIALKACQLTMCHQS